MTLCTQVFTSGVKVHYNAYSLVTNMSYVGFLIREKKI